MPTQKNAGSAVRDMLSIADVLNNPDMARVYAYVAKTAEEETSEEGVTVEEITNELDIPQATAYDYVGRLADASLVSKQGEARPYGYTAEEVNLKLTKDGNEYTVSPELIDAVSRRGENRNIDAYIDRHGVGGVATALEYAERYVDGEMNHRLMARELDVSPIEAETILQELRKIILEHLQKHE